MGSALQKAVALIVSADAELLNILSVTARMSLQSSLIALLLGVPIGIWLGACRFPGRHFDSRNYTSSITAISAASPRRSPVRVTRV